MHVLDKNPEDEEEERGFRRRNATFHQRPFEGNQGAHFTFGFDGDAPGGGMVGDGMILGVAAGIASLDAAIGHAALSYFLLCAKAYFQLVLLPVCGGAGWWEVARGRGIGVVVGGWGKRW